MATTTYTDASMAANVIGARTDAAGTPVTDESAEEARMSNVLLGEGKLQANSFVPAAGSAATMNVLFGSGSAKSDYYVVAGEDAGQGNYIVRLQGTTVTVALDAADGSLARKDQVYLVVADNAYDGSATALPRIGLRTGTAAASPVVPGPDAGWDASVLLATIDVPAAAADILACTITDARVDSALTVRNLVVGANLTVAGSISVTGTVDGVDVAAHDHDGTALGGTAIDAGDLTGLKTAVDAANVDADTLDGSHASAFAGASHVGAGGGAHPDATTSVDGFMTAADKSKLDGIATGADVNPSHTAGGGISIGGSGSGSSAVTISHADTSSAGNLNTSGATIIDYITLDTYGHITAQGTRTLTAANIGAATTSHNHDGDYYQYAAGTPRITISTSAASGGSNGDIWFKY